ncbi:hypothetical protein FDB29_08960 [Clostridium botulinum]|nr:hypothetical protein [Clostridium botulinum]
MNEISKKLALVLDRYDELPMDIKKNIDYYKENKEVPRLRGDLRVFEILGEYLYVDITLYENSLLKSIYGNRVYRTNEDSFTTLIHDYFTLFTMIMSCKPTKAEINEYIVGMDNYIDVNCIENLWHLLNLVNQCIKDSYNPNFSSLLSFYSIIELLVLNDTRNRSIVEECVSKLPEFYKEINILNFPAKNKLNSRLSEEEIFKKLTKLRHKVIHGIFVEARSILDSLFPNISENNRYSGNTEDAESSAFQDQIQNLNDLIRNELGQILKLWMKSPERLSSIKSS